MLLGGKLCHIGWHRKPNVSKKKKLVNDTLLGPVTSTLKSDYNHWDSAITTIPEGTQAILKGSKCKIINVQLNAYSTLLPPCILEGLYLLAT